MIREHQLHTMNTEWVILRSRASIVAVLGLSGSSDANLSFRKLLCTNHVIHEPYPYRLCMLLPIIIHNRHNYYYARIRNYA